MRRQDDDRGRRRGLASALLLTPLGLAAAAEAGAEEGGGEPLAWTLRSRVGAPGTGGRYHVVERPASWAPRRTAIIVCDV
jgi:hypothetical protein